MLTETVRCESACRHTETRFATRYYNQNSGGCKRTDALGDNVGKKIRRGYAPRSEETDGYRWIEVPT